MEPDVGEFFFDFFGRSIRAPEADSHALQFASLADGCGEKVVFL